MDSVKRSAVTPSKSRLARTFGKVFHIQALTRVSRDDDGIQKTTKSNEKAKKDHQTKHTNIPSLEDEDEELLEKAVNEAFFAKLFASTSAIKAAYAQLQYAQSPYDPDGIQSADQTVVAQLKTLSELKQCYVKKQLNETSPEMTILLSEIQEQKSQITTYEIMSKKLDFQIKLKDSEITFLKEKLAGANRANKTLEKKLNSSGPLTMPDDIQLSGLRPSYFVAQYQHALKSIQSFVRLMISEMESADWDLDAAASSIRPNVSFWKPNHKCLAFESYVCREMFEGFNHPNFSAKTEQEKLSRQIFFDQFMGMKSTKPSDYLAWKPKSRFAAFCREKYLKLIHEKMEEALFGNLEQRDLVRLGDFPEMPFFSAFAEVAKRVWLLHCLAMSFDPEVSIFQVSERSRFSEVYMENLSDEAFVDVGPGDDPRVAFVVVPGFMVGKTVVQCQVYLC